MNHPREMQLLLYDMIDSLVCQSSYLNYYTSLTTQMQKETQQRFVHEL